MLLHFSLLVCQLLKFYYGCCINYVLFYAKIVGRKLRNFSCLLTGWVTYVCWKSNIFWYYNCLNADTIRNLVYLSQLANCRLQFLLNRLGRCIKLFVSTERTSSHEFTSRFGLYIFLNAKNTQKLWRIPSRPRARLRDCSIEWTSDAGKCGHGWDPLTRRTHCDHSGDQFSQNGHSKWPQWQFIPSQLEKCGFQAVARAFVMFIRNQQWRIGF